MHDPQRALERYTHILERLDASGPDHHQGVQLNPEDSTRVLRALVSLRRLLKHPLPNQRDTSLESLVPEDLLQEVDLIIQKIVDQ